MGARNRAKTRVTLGDQRPVGASARVPADLRGDGRVAKLSGMRADVGIMAATSRGSCARGPGRSGNASTTR
jgi:hypothetical protein